LDTSAPATGSSKPIDPHYRPDVEGLRGVAVLLVVAYHAGLPGTSGGFVGVDVFFVISGYVITALILREIRANDRFRFGAFYARRARRLLPASTLTVLTTLALGYAFLSPFEFEELGKAAASTLMFGSNVWFSIQATDYLAPGNEANPLLHTWSLGVEEQFYLVWPALIVLALRLRRPLALITGVTLASYVLCVALTDYNQPVAFFAMPARAWQFGLGAIAVFLPARFANVTTVAHGSVPFVGAALVAVAATYIDSTMAFPGWLALLPSLGAMLLLHSGAGAPNRFLSSRPMQFVGGLSYTWYLWHWPALVFAGILFPDHRAAALAAVVLSFAVSVVTHYLFENPIRYSPVLLPRPALSLGLSALLVACSVGVCYAAYRTGKHAMELPDQRALVKAVEDDPKFAGCALAFLESSGIDCAFGDPSSARTIVLFGDSHAFHWAPAFEAIAVRMHLRLVLAIKNYCPSVDVPIHNPYLRRTSHECAEWRTSEMARIKALNPLLVVLSNSSSYIQRAGQTSGAARLTLAQWRDGLRKTLTELEGTPIVILTDVPVPGHHIPECLSRAAWRSLDGDRLCGFPRSTAIRGDVRDAEHGAASERAGAKVVDLSDMFCGEARCDARRDGFVLYRDSNHVAGRYALALVPTIAERLSLELQ
jgi:peptidoglycan/LPS O-acetylase OafA/YrhL